MLKQAINELLDRRIEETTTGLRPCYAKVLRIITEENTTIIADYISAARTEINLSDHYRKDLIQALSIFSRHTGNKHFRQMTRSDIISFLESFRKTDAADPLHKWIGTYNIFRIHLMRFFKWLHSPDIEPSKRSKPPILENVPKLRRKETSIYKPSDLWTHQDDLLFLEYCPSKRDRLYHAISRDSSYCNKYKIDLSTNGIVITDAIKYINGKMDHLNNQEKKLL